MFVAISRIIDIEMLHQYVDYFYWAVWVIPLFVLMHINQAALRGLHLFGWGSLQRNLCNPFLFL